VIIVIFSVVCFLLLLAFSYASCFHFSIGSSGKQSRLAKGCSLEPEDTTYKQSSFENQSVQNVV
uniref:Si:ch73-208h1.4 n=1 Tax=Cyprinodon variegatus TaxID=28743 RepID=A0A3Q2FRJ7_CYPVA